MNANQLHKVKIEEFWNSFGGWKPKKDYSEYKETDKLEALVRMAEVRIVYHKQKPLFSRRSEFEEIKQTICRQKIGSPCFVCSCPGFARHHIIQLQYGGINSRRNVVILCDICHAGIHPWLRPLPVPLRLTLDVLAR